MRRALCFSALSLVLAVHSCRVRRRRVIRPRRVCHERAERESLGDQRVRRAVADGRGRGRVGNGDFCASAAKTNPALAVSGGAAAAQVKADINRAVATAPGAIKGDMQKMADVELPILDGNVPPAQISQQLVDPAFRAAVQHVSVWAASNCGG